jgi:hypothetical protein
MCGWCVSWFLLCQIRTIEIQLATAIAYGLASLNVIPDRHIWIIFRYRVGRKCVKYPLLQTFTEGKMLLSYSHLTCEKCTLTLSDWARPLCLSVSLSLSLSLPPSLPGMGIINRCAELINHMHAELQLKMHGALFPLSLCAPMAWFIGLLIWSNF